MVLCGLLGVGSSTAERWRGYAGAAWATLRLNWSLLRLRSVLGSAVFQPRSSSTRPRLDLVA